MGITGGMRFRKSRPSDGMLGRLGGDDREGRKRHSNETRFLIASALLALCALGGLVRYYRGERAWHGDGRRQHRHHKNNLNAGLFFSSSDSPECTPSPLEKRKVVSEYGCHDIKKMLKGEKTFLGRGFWREVFLVTYEGRQMAVKRLRDTQEDTRRNKERHRWEAAAMDAVQGHKNVVGLLGRCGANMATEYFPVFMDELILPDSSDETLPDELPMHRVVEMALDAARGLQALHEAPGGPIVHADLQPRQLLLDENGVVKVNDLNRCRFMGRDAEGNYCPFRISKGNGVWRSPEEYQGAFLTEKLDVYSMGMIFWSMLARDTPFERDDYYKTRVLGGERPHVDPSWHKGFVALFEDMWQQEPAKRPPAGEVVVRLEEMLEDLPTSK